MVALWFGTVVSFFFFFLFFPQCTARGSLEMQDAKNRQKIVVWHHPTTLSGYIFAIKATYRQSEKNLLSNSISSTCPHNMVILG